MPPCGNNGITKCAATRHIFSLPAIRLPAGAATHRLRIDSFGAMFLGIFIGWIWGYRNAGDELRSGSSVGERSVRRWGFSLRRIRSALILLVIVSLFPAGARLLAFFGIG